MNVTVHVCTRPLRHVRYCTCWYLAYTSCTLLYMLVLGLYVVYVTVHVGTRLYVVYVTVHVGTWPIRILYEKCTVHVATWPIYVISNDGKKSLFSNEVHLLLQCPHTYS